jgi:hypothetical protein
MKNLLYKIQVTGLLAGILHIFSTETSCAQNDFKESAGAVKLSNQFAYQMLEFRVNASEINTNKYLDEPGKLLDDKIELMQQSLKGAISVLGENPSEINRKQRTIFWLEVMAAIDAYSDTNILEVDISGYIYPPPAYTGKVGPWGMIQPDTNDADAYAYYVSAVREFKKKSAKALYLHALERLNNLVDADFKLFLQMSYASSEADKEEFKTLVKQSLLSDSRKQKLRTLFDGAH